MPGNVQNIHPHFQFSATVAAVVQVTVAAHPLTEAVVADRATVAVDRAMEAVVVLTTATITTDLTATGKNPHYMETPIMTVSSEAVLSFVLFRRQSSIFRIMPVSCLHRTCNPQTQKILAVGVPKNYSSETK